MEHQAKLRFPSRHGGARKGAGRPRGKRISHGRRPRFDRITAAHITLRARRGVANLRNSRCFRRILRCLRKARYRFGLRVIHFTVLGNHLHLIVEADTWESLSRGMKGLEVRLAHALNRLMGRSGALFDDHYHSRALPTPTEVVSAIAYVLGNAEHHFGTKDRDPCSSAGLTEELREIVLCVPEAWLLAKGWGRGKAAEKLERFGFSVA